MKVVLFCGGMGTRLREYSESIPKPLVPIGYRPVLWHVMKYYAHFGHKDFILCLGYMADRVKEYFLNYQESTSNDFVMSEGGKRIDLINSDISDWRITFVDTGFRSSVGMRLRAVEEYLEGEEFFLANYTDGLTDMPLDDQIDVFKRSGKIACFMCSRPSQTFHVVSLRNDCSVESIKYVKDADIWMNAGYFVFRKEIFEHIRAGEDLVVEPFRRLIDENQLLAYKYERFWAMDTFKEQQELTDMSLEGHAPWQVWKHPNGTPIR
ncbi:MAG: glucose-1-phosphate cytidylyltransferase [Armatimonadetes bacterium]|nr:glucose-1-phosphate cytidylyltransferase [Armatimonadota bacterium]